MKKILIVLAVSIGLYSCEEKGPTIDFGNSISEFSDTTYTAPVEASEAHRVLVEEFTGASCPNCPAAREKLAVMSDANPGRIIVLAIHPNGIPQGAPVEGHSKYNFRTEKGTTVMNDVYGGVIGIPVAGIDRVPIDGSLAFNSTVWNSAITNRLPVASPINLSVTSSYDAAVGKALIKVKIVYTQAIDFTHALSLVILEDNIVDAQEFPPGIPVDEEYSFKHVLRDYVTSINGTVVLPGMASKPAGTTYEAQFYYPVSGEWKPENCHAVAYVHRNDGSSKEIIQAAEAHLSE